MSWTRTLDRPSLVGRCALLALLAVGCHRGDPAPGSGSGEALGVTQAPLTCPPGWELECTVCGPDDGCLKPIKTCQCDPPPPPPPPQAGTIANGGNCVDIASYAPGTSPTDVACDSTKPSQAWAVDFTNETIKPSRNDGRCLQVIDPNVSDGSGVALADCNSSGSQQFAVTQVQFRSYINQQGLGMVANTIAGGQVLTSKAGQVPTTWTIGSDGTIAAPGAGYCLGLPGGSTATGTHATNSPCNGQATQQWRIGTGRIESVAANLCLTLNASAGTIDVESCADASNEWAVIMTIPSQQKSSMCLTADPSGVLAMHACSGAASQTWTVEGSALDSPYLPPAAVRVLGGGPLSTAVADGNYEMWGWGDNTHGQLGGQYGGNFVTAQAGPLFLASTFTGGNGFNCAVAFLAVYCLGTNALYQLPQATAGADSYKPLQSPLAQQNSPSSTVQAGANFACTLQYDGTVYCWGTVANGTQPYEVGTPSQPAKIFSGVAQMAVGGNHVCALGAGGSVQCWGSNTWGQTGGGTSTFASVAQQVVLPAGFSAQRIFAGDDATCARGADDTMLCWGSNGKGAFATGKTPPYRLFEPTPIPALTGMMHMWLGEDYSCGNHGDRTLECWGDNANGQLGDGKQTARTTMAPVSLTNVVDAVISHGAQGPWRTCALLADGTVECWGSNANGALGTTFINFNADSLFPVLAQVGIYLPPPPPPPQ